MFSSGAYAAAVDIDRATGKLTVLRVVAVDDAGTIINPLLAHGQIVGGVVQGLGECVIEEAIYDEDGQLRTATFVDYGLLTAAELPEIVTGEVVEPLAAQPARGQGRGRGRSDRDAAGGGQRGGRRARGRSRRSAVHLREAVASGRLLSA